MATNEKVKAIAGYFQRENNKNEFVKNAVKNAGYPQWDKAFVATNNGFAQRGGSVTVDSTDIAYIPFVVDEDSTTTAVLVVGINPTDTLYSLMWPQEFQDYGFDTTANSWNARNLFHLFTDFDYAMFGHKKFIVPDGRIFGAGPTDTLIVTRDFEEERNINTRNRSNYEEWEVCVVVNVSGVMHAFRSNIYAGPAETPICTKFYWIPDWESPTTPSPIIWESLPNPPAGQSWGGTWYPADLSAFTGGEIHNSSIIDSLQGFPCAQEILAQLPSINAEIVKILDSVFYINDTADLYFKAKTDFTKDSIDGYTDIPSGSASFFRTTIYINPWVMANSTKEYIAATLIHESLHAYVNYWYFQYKYYHVIDSNQFKAKFPIFWDHYRNDGFHNQPSQSHNEMAERYVDLITDFLKSYHFNISNSMAKAIAWGGLQESDVWKTRSDTNTIYNLNHIARQDGTTTNNNLYTNHHLRKCD